MTPDEEGEWCWPKKSRVTRWGRRIDSRPAFHFLAEDDEGEQASGGLNHLVSRNARGAQWTWKKVTVVVDTGAAENVMPRSMFSEIGIRQTERGPRMEKDSKDQEERTPRIMGSLSCPSRPLRDFCTRAHGRLRT